MKTDEEKEAARIRKRNWLFLWIAGIVIGVFMTMLGINVGFKILSILVFWPAVIFIIRNFFRVLGTLIQSFDF